jgi:pimeloyl-ACP methyl ester carboxylesterase
VTAQGFHELTPGAPGGPVAVLAHGLEDSWESWFALARQLGPDWRTIALDLPWRPGNDYRWRTKTSAEWLGEALESAGARADLVIAHSYGANALMNLLAAGDPRAASPSVLICPLYRPPDVAITWKIFDRARRAFEQHIRDSLLSRLSGRVDRIGADVVETMIAKALDRVGPAGFLAVFEQFVSSATVALDAVDSPVLVLAGGSDPTLSRQAATTLARQISRARLHVGDDYDHFCYVRRPAEVADRILRFAGDLTHAHPLEGAVHD